MPFCLSRRLGVLGLTLLLSHVAAAPATAPSADDVSRARAVRAVLLDLLERSYASDGAWPASLPASAPDGLVYAPPAKPTSTPPQDGPRGRHVASATVVLHESPDRHARGVWVGYADGHLEFAPDAEALASCKAQLPIVLEAPAATPDLPSKPGSGRLTARVIDPDGRPVQGARVGIWNSLGNAFNNGAPGPLFIDEQTPTLTDADGRATLDGEVVFRAKFIIQDTAPLYVLHEGRQLVAQVDVARTEFADASAQTPVKEIRLAPACRVIGEATGVDLPPAQPGGRVIQLANSFRPGNKRMYTLTSAYNGRHFEFLLPPGDYGIDAYGPGSASVYRFLRIAPGQREIRLYPDLPPDTASRLTGHPAPEFQKVKAWKNTQPLTLADLKGKAVILDFWGYWCNPCCEAMPELMKLYDELKDRGLVVIAVHDDSVESIAEMDQKLVAIRNKLWAGRDLPFPVLLDGGGPTRIKYTATTARGATTAAYGITSFPTTLLIGPDGTLLGDFEPSSKKDRAWLEGLLQSK